jgi:molecular chaperone DnaK
MNLIPFAGGGERNPESPIRVLGIDLGTTNSTVAEIVWKPSDIDAPRTRVLEIDQKTSEGLYTHTLIPSVVAINEGKLVVGEGAKRLRSRMSEKGLELYRSIFWETKNLIGARRTFNKAPEGFRSARDIAGHVLKFLADSAMKQDETSVARAVITVPASFQLSQREDTIQAAKLAGLDLRPGDLLDEPVAAFLDYLHTHKISELGKSGQKLKVLVFDFGGGTCDVALFEITVPEVGGPFQLSPASVTRYHRLGGGDIDAAIVHEVLIPELLKQNGLGQYDLDFDEKDREAMPALLGVAEALKVGLCSVLEREIKFGKYDDSAKARLLKTQPGEHEVPIKRIGYLKLKSPSLSVAQFEKVLEPFLDPDLLYPKETEYYTSCSVFAPLQDGLERAGWKGKDISHCLLAGGSSLIPQLAERLQTFLEKADILRFPDAEQTQTAIARGAALHALSLAITSRGLVIPVAGDSISIRAQDGDHPLIERGESLPTSNVLRRLSVPRSSLLEPMNLRIELVRSDERTLISKLFKLKPPFNKDEPLEVRCRLDENQRLALEVVYSGVGGEQKIEVELENPLSNVVNPNRRRERLADLEENMRTGEVPKANQSVTFDEIVSIHKELGHRQKASQLLKNKLKLAQSNSERFAITLQLGILADEMKDWVAVEKFYRESFRLSESGAPLFNFALSLSKRGESKAALKVIEEAINADEEAPFYVLKGRIQKTLGDGAGCAASLETAFKLFNDVSDLNDWALAWFLTASEMKPEPKQADAAKAEQKRRSATKSQPAGEEAGVLPAGPSSIVKRES